VGLRAAIALLLPAAIALAACSGNDDAASGPAPRLDGPASRYAAGVEELPGNFNVLPPETYAVTDEVWAREGLFPEAGEGQEFASQNGYLDGWRVTYTPDGLLAGVVSAGQYYVTVETFLFESTSGAVATYDHYEDTYGDIAGTDEVDVARVGNRSSGWSFIEGVIPGTEFAAIYHRVVFQRGNLVAVVQTYGLENTLRIDSAREIAIIVDNRALGTAEAIEPTPITPLLPTPPGG
jgi:hypothetical protein